MKISGMITGCEKKPKSWKLTIDKKGYYIQEDCQDLVGKMVEVEWHDSAPYPNPVNKDQMITSKQIKSRQDIAVLTGSNGVGGGVIHNLPEKATLGHQNAKNDHCEPDWEAINAEKRRSIALSYSIELINGGKIPLTDLYKRADEIVNYMKSGEQEIPF